MRKVIGLIICSVLLLGISIALLLPSGCTKNARVKSFGGKAKIELPKGTKLLMVTWKEDNIWYLTRPMKDDDKAETYTFQEKSSFGVAEGTYTISEQK